MKKSNKQQKFSDWVVGIGASAGGLEALVSFVSNIPPEFDGSIIVAQHLAPHSKSMMVELLSRQSTLPVLQVEDQMILKPSTIYVVPPNHDLDLIDSRMVLHVADEAIRPKPSVDEFFESLARSYKDKAVGIILSGTGSDGSRGIEAIKEVGGITLAQDDQSAKYDGMPKSAVDTGKVDTILPPEILAKNLTKIISDHAQRKISENLDPEGLTPIYNIIHERLGQDFSRYKTPTIRRRIAKRMNLLGKKDYTDYAKHLKQTPGEIGELAKDLLISVTSFFRDPEVFQDLQHRLTEQLRNAPANHEFRAWIAGCATGEEAYTLALILLDIQERLRKNFPIKIFATDLDHEAIQEARLGVYSTKDVQNVSPSLIERFFQPRGPDNYELIKRVRDCVVFARQDLIQNPPFVKLDLISCRNVMIYFEPDLQRRLLEIFHYALIPSGILVLGKSESILSTPQLFEILDKKNKIFEKLNVATQHVATHKLAKPISLEPSMGVRKPVTTQSLVDIGYKKLLKAFDLCGVIVDAEATIIQIIGDVSPYLRFQHLHPDLRLTNLLPKGMGIEIPILIRKALQNGTPYKSRTTKLGKSDTIKPFQLTVRPLYDEDDDAKSPQSFLLVSFEQKKAKEIQTLPEISSTTEIPNRMAELEHELHVTREHLQTVVEELGVSNEELQSLNEELSSTNEELQSTNEELETTNEELQSSNEELTTVNEELTAKSTELRMASLGLENIQNSIGSPLVVLDDKFRLQNFNTDANKIFFISETDIGRDITRISSRFEIPDFTRLIGDTLSTGKPNEGICESNDTVFQLRVFPSFDETRKIIGVVLSFIDNTELIRTQHKLTASEEKTRAIIEASPALVSLKDNLGRYLLVNSAFKKFFHISGDIVGKTDREILNSKTAVQLRDADLEIFITREVGQKEEVIETAKGVKHVLLANRFPLMDNAGKSPIAVGTIAIDITSQVEVQNKLQTSETLYRAIAEDQAVLVARHKPKGAVTYANETFSQYFGVNSLAADKKKFVDHIAPTSQDEAEQILNSITIQKPIAHFEHPIFRWNNETRWVRWIHKGIFDAKGELIEIQSVGFDVTEYRHQTDRLKEKEAVFAGIFDNTSDFITLFRVVNGSLFLESLNRSAEAVLGIAGNQLIGRPLQDFFNREQNTNLIERYENVVLSKKAEVFEEEVVFGGGLRHFLTTLVPIPDNNGRIERVAALSRDISTYKVIENDLRQAKESAEVANKAKSDFLASMSHELRTPLNVVLGYCQMLELSKLDVEQLNLVGGIHRSGQLLLSLIEDILDISKIEAGKIRFESIAFSIHDFVNEVAELFKTQVSEKGLTLKTTISERAQRNVVGDPNRLRQVLVNFIGNAIKFTYQGHLQIDVDVEEINLSGDAIFKFSVKDTGIGIKPADKSKIFQKFSQADSGHARRFGGSGLGLAISKQLIVLMNGEIGFDSVFGQGSTFWFKIPLILTNRASTMRTLDRNQSIPAAAENRALNVLVVDDNFDSRTVADLFLKRLGHTCDAADSGAMAIEFFKTCKYDLILMDMQMPEMDGCETSRTIRELESGHIPIIALTANALTEDVERCFASGMDDYLSKPVRMEDLNYVLNKWAFRLFNKSVDSDGNGTGTDAH